MKPQYLSSNPQSGHRDRWMISYVDVLTILLVFFIAAAARSVDLQSLLPNVVKVSAAAAAPPATDEARTFAAPSGGLAPTWIPGAGSTANSNAEPATEATNPSPSSAQNANTRSPLEDALDSLKSRGIEASLETRGLMISLPQTILYAPGDDRVSAQAMTVVAQIAAILKTLPNHVDLIGHADSSPIHNARFKNNWELSAARGLRLLELLSAKYGIEESRLSVSSDGANSPLETNDTPEGRAANRRVEILILN